MPLILGCELNNSLRKRILNLAELRNRIVHYKAEPCGYDEDSESHNGIANMTDQINFSDMLSIPIELETELEFLLEKENPNHQLAKKITEAMF